MRSAESGLGEDLLATGIHGDPPQNLVVLSDIYVTTADQSKMKTDRIDLAIRDGSMDAIGGVLVTCCRAKSAWIQAFDGHQTLSRIGNPVYYKVQL